VETLVSCQRSTSDASSRLGQRTYLRFPLKHAYVWTLLKPSKRALSFADGVIAFYDTKYTYNFWRPVTPIRGAALEGTLEH
jgi:hypothetical protein